ncbi:MaoC family dehydratase N-terminal domain-containing protein [Alicyclobacillus curvatus]|jgi:acyl dehydratase|nr:MaoC family dehydratase N-terminal domain-containing protein [Alicyclobacillus curvatus]
MAHYAEGEMLKTLTKPPITKTQLVMYSGASGDFNPIHTVEEFAVKAGLGGVIAHGMLTMAFVGQMLTDIVGENGTLVDFGVRFKGMVRPGDIITCGGQVTKVQDEPGGQRVFASVFAQTDKGDRVVTGDAEFTTYAI